jgi:transcription elongation factor GreB
MSKAFVKEDAEADEDPADTAEQLPAGSKNYITPAGFARLRAEQQHLLEVVDPTRQRRTDQVFFGATVTYADSKDREHTVTIVGIDEVDPQRGRVSWISPIARALMKASVGDVVRVHTPNGLEPVELLAITYAQSEDSAPPDA